MLELLAHFGQQLRTRRKMLGLTQEMLAEIVDLSPTYIAKLEAGAKTPSLETLVSLAKALETTPSSFLPSAGTSPNAETAAMISAAMADLDGVDAAFAQEHLLRLISHLRRTR